MAEWDDFERRENARRRGERAEEAEYERSAEHPFADRPDEWRRIRDTGYAGVPGQDEGTEGPGPYYAEYQISGEVLRPDGGRMRRPVSYEAPPEGGEPWDVRRSGVWVRASGPQWRRPSERWVEAGRPRGWERISRGHALGHPPEAWTRPGSTSVTTGGVGGHYGRGPKGYVRSDERIREDVCDRFMSSDRVDCGQIEVNVQNGEVTLSGTVNSRQAKHCVEDIAAEVLGVKDVDNRLRVGEAAHK
jgi:hypothetical protein